MTNNLAADGGKECRAVWISRVAGSWRGIYAIGLLELFLEKKVERRRIKKTMGGKKAHLKNSSNQR